MHILIESIVMDLHNRVSCPIRCTYRSFTHNRLNGLGMKDRFLISAFCIACSFVYRIPFARAFLGKAEATTMGKAGTDISSILVSRQ